MRGRTLAPFSKLRGPLCCVKRQALLGLTAPLLKMRDFTPEQTLTHTHTHTHTHSHTQTQTHIHTLQRERKREKKRILASVFEEHTIKEAPFCNCTRFFTQAAQHEESSLPVRSTFALRSHTLDPLNFSCPKPSLLPALGEGRMVCPHKAQDRRIGHTQTHTQAYLFLLPSQASQISIFCPPAQFFSKTHGPIPNRTSFYTQDVWLGETDCVGVKLPVLLKKKGVLYVWKIKF